MIGHSSRGTMPFAAILTLAAMLALPLRPAPAEGAEGLRLSVSDIHDQDDKEAAAAPKAVQIVATRNGGFSGKVVASWDKPIAGLKAACGELKGPGGAAIPAEKVQIRYGLPWTSGRGRRAPNACLSEAPQKGYAAGAAAPIWITVQVPKDAPAGAYAGELTVLATGAAAAKVPVRVTVADWTLPDTQRYASWADFYQVPDTSAIEYQTPLWSDKHWGYIERSLRLLGQLGNKTLYIPLIAHTNMGNEESMVRWIEKDGNRFDYDFSIAEKYLDLAEKCMGKPEVVCLAVWELYMLPESMAVPEDDIRKTVKVDRGRAIVQARQALNIKEKGGKLGMGPLVTELYRATGKAENAWLPRYTEAGSKTFWAPVLSGMKERLAKRGLDKAMMLGVFSDSWASKEEVAFFQELLPGTPWVVQSHYGADPTKLLYDIAKVGYQTRVWGGIRFADGQKQTNQTLPPSAEAQHGWKIPDRVAIFERNTGLDAYPIARWRFFMETGVTSTARGVGRLGGDFWAALRTKAGERAGNVAARYPEAHRRNLNLCNCILCPAPEGPAATDRFEAFREGLQECEARIAVERALLDPALKARLGDELAKRAQDVLNERLACMWKALSNNPGAASPGQWRWAPGPAGHAWFLKSGWQERSDKLYSLAGEVERKLGPRAEGASAPPAAGR